MSIQFSEECKMTKAPVRNVMLGFRVTAAMKRALERAAIDDNRSLSSLIVAILDGWLKERKYLSGDRKWVPK